MMAGVEEDGDCGCSEVSKEEGESSKARRRRTDFIPQRNRVDRIGFPFSRALNRGRLAKQTSPQTTNSHAHAVSYRSIVRITPFSSQHTLIQQRGSTTKRNLNTPTQLSPRLKQLRVKIFNQLPKQPRSFHVQR